MDQRLSAKRWLSFALALGMLLSTLCVSAFAVGIDEAKASVANVAIEQTYNTKANNAATHDYRTDGTDVTVTYKATLSMTETMAAYLQARQKQLYEAQFAVKINVDLDKLEWATAGKQTFTFKSMFLKPVVRVTDTAYDVEFVERDDVGNFVYKITAENPTGNSFTIPVELIAYYNRADGDPMSYDEAAAKQVSGELMYANYNKEDWMAPITLELASLKVTEATRKSVTPSNAVTVSASGTVQGTFSYITAEVPENIGRITAILAQEKEDNKIYHNTLAFGTGTPDAITDAWVSNVVTLRLIYSIYVDPDTPTHLNTDDHFAYIIGRTTGDGSPATASPEAQITRAEVATIFFRMLKDDSRSLYWSSENSYPDVASDAWYNNAVSTLTNMGIINGRDGGLFAPDEPITRAEFATIAVRFFDTSRLETLGNAFSDIDGKWYTQYVNYAALLELVNGRPDGTYHPDDNITRAEAMTIVNNTLRRTPAVSSFAKVKGDMIVWEDNMDTDKWYYAAVQEATNSHDYQRASMSDTEVWTKILPVRDWAAFEKEWSDANSAKNPGNVVDGNP